VQALQDGRQAGTEGQELRRLLIEPLEHRVAAASTLIVIPDGGLCRLPFAALGNEDRFLVEDYRLATAPGASVYIALTERYGERSRKPPGSVLIVGEPLIDRSLFPTLTSLPGSAEEIENLERIYDRRAILLTGHAATAERLLALLPDVDVLHVSVHTVTPQGGDAPGLVLTSSPATRKTGVLLPEDIHCPRGPRARLAILAGCRTAEGRLSQNEGSLGLARAFLSAGIPTVLASLWDADDEPAARLLLRCHEFLRSGADPLTALRHAQLELLRGPDRHLTQPRTWAAFEVIGGALPIEIPSPRVR
jgi:CHAT domain-containing protein